MYYHKAGMRGMGVDLTALTEALKQVPSLAQTGVKVAGAVETVKSPDFQAQLKKAEQDITDYMYAQLALRTLSTFAIIGLFAISLAQAKKGR